MPVADLLHHHPHAWARATRHPFLDAVRDGDVPGPAFDAWLVQDHRFLADLLRFQARLLARAPRQAQAVLAGGCTALVEELTWFEHTATARTLDLGGDALPATEAYAALLDRTKDHPEPRKITQHPSHTTPADLTSTLLIESDRWRRKGVTSWVGSGR